MLSKTGLCPTLKREILASLTATLTARRVLSHIDPSAWSSSKPTFTQRSSLAVHHRKRRPDCKNSEYVSDRISRAFSGWQDDRFRAEIYTIHTPSAPKHYIAGAGYYLFSLFLVAVDFQTGYTSIAGRKQMILDPYVYL